MDRALLRSLCAANDYIARTHGNSGMFATLFWAVLNPESGFVHYVNAGHEPPVVIRKAGKKIRLKRTGPAVGIEEGAEFSAKRFRMAEGDLLFAYTDGVVDALSPVGEAFSRARVEAILDHRKGSAGEVIERFVSLLRAHCRQDTLFDDITLLGLRRRPRAHAVDTGSETSPGS